MSSVAVVVHRDAPLLARAVAARLITRLVDVQAEYGEASVVLTGGGVGTSVLAEVAHSPARDAVDWQRLDVWWGDERYLPPGHEERNETSTRAALLDTVALDPDRVHPMPADDGAEAEQAAEAYAAALHAAARPEGGDRVPAFDVLLLGLGEDGHVASLFPGMPALQEERLVVAVRDAPKAPPIRLTLTLPTIRTAREVWVVAAGEGKAEAARLALGDAAPAQVPAARARGRDRTLWLLDRVAAAAIETAHFASQPMMGRSSGKR